jgi:translation initiation factor 3 subunit M
MTVTSSTLVNVSDDAEVRLVALLAAGCTDDADKFTSACQASIDAGQMDELLNTIFKSPGAIAHLLTLQPAEDAVSALAVIAALMERAGRTTQEVADTIVNCAVNGGANERKITLLSTLYNMQANPVEKCNYLNQMYGLTREEPHWLAPEQPLGYLLRDAHVVEGTVSQPRLLQLFDNWNLATEERQKLYRTIASVLPAQQDGSSLRQRYVLLLVESFQDGGSAEALAAAKVAAIGAIRDPISLFVYQRNLLSLPAVQALKKSDAKLYGLLQVFQEGNLADYDAVLKTSGGDAYLQSLGLDAEDCKRNIRILSLCSLASEMEEIPYSILAETLQLQDGQVESWVIAAVSSGLLQAKMDQLEKKVMVERSVVRRFDMAQWKVLQSRLETWKKNLDGVLTGLKDIEVASVGN